MLREKTPAILQRWHIWTAVVVNVLVVISSIIGTANYLIPKMISYHVSELIEGKYQPRWESEFQSLRIEIDKDKQVRTKELDTVIGTIEKLNISNDLSHAEIRVDLRAIYTTLLSMRDKSAER